MTADEETKWGIPKTSTCGSTSNGRRFQRSHTGKMIFSVAELISYLSRVMTLMPGDLIAAGTPPGVGLGQKPHPIYLKPGDEVRLGIDELGE